MEIPKKTSNKRVQKEIENININRVHSMGIILMLMQAGMLIYSYIVDAPYSYRYLYLSLFIVGAISFYFTLERFRNNSALQLFILIFVVYLFSFWGIGISVLDYFRSVAAYVYIISISVVISFLIGSPWEILLFSLINMITFFSILYYFDAITSALLINISSFHLVSIMIGIDKYKSVTENIEKKLELIKLNEELQVLSTIDQLSGCVNRRGLLKSFEQFKGNVIFAMLVDLDNFKKINDKYGHDVGNLFIVNFAKILQSNFGIKNIFRLEGDQFFIFSDSESLEVCIKKYNTSCKEIANISLIAHSDIKLTTSAGYTYKLVDTSCNFEKLYKYLDVALCTAKNTGKNKMVKVDEPLK